MLLIWLCTACAAPEAPPDPKWLDADADGWRPGDGDCDDADAEVLPGAAEHCDGRDEDCDGDVDEDPEGADTWYADEDGDGFGNPYLYFPACGEGDGRTLDATDCDDTSAAAFPGGVEQCDGVDNDCDGIRDDDASDIRTWHADDDGDGYGNSNSANTGCEAPPGSVEAGGDCNDADAGIHPDAEDNCDGIDNDCDGAEVCALACDLAAAEVLALAEGPFEALAFGRGLLYAAEPGHSPDMLYALDPLSGAVIESFVSNGDGLTGLGAEEEFLYVPGDQIDTYNLTSHSWNASVENPCRGERGGAAALDGVVWQVCALSPGSDLLFTATDPATGGLLATLPIPEAWGTVPAELDSDGDNLLYVSKTPLCDAVECPTELHIFDTSGAEVCSQTLYTDANVELAGLAAGPGALYLHDSLNARILVFRPPV